MENNTTNVENLQHAIRALTDIREKLANSQGLRTQVDTTIAALEAKIKNLSGR